MMVTNLTLYQLVTFHGETVSRPTAFEYVEFLEKAKSPFIFVEKREDGMFNVIGGFKYVDGIRYLQKDQLFKCLVLDTFTSEKDRKIACLQHCLANMEKVIYKEILVHELTHKFDMNEKSISKELGMDAKKVKRYMYKQVIPKTYFDKAHSLGLKGFVQAIYLNKQYTDFEKQILTELILYPSENERFKQKHLPLYNQYRKEYLLFEDFYEAKEQVLKAIHVDTSTKKYWSNTPHPLHHTVAGSSLNYENQKTH